MSSAVETSKKMWLLSGRKGIVLVCAFAIGKFASKKIRQNLRKTVQIVETEETKKTVNTLETVVTVETVETVAAVEIVEPVEMLATVATLQ